MKVVSPPVVRQFPPRGGVVAPALLGQETRYEVIKVGLVAAKFLLYISDAT